MTAPYHDPPTGLIHVWTAQYPDGTEGIISGDMPMPIVGATRHMPLMSSKKDIALRLRHLAEDAVKAEAKAAGKPAAKATLVTYKRLGS